MEIAICVMIAVLLLISIFNLIIMVTISSFVLKLAEAVKELRGFLESITDFLPASTVPPVEGQLREVDKTVNNPKVKKQLVTSRLDDQGNVIEQEVENL
jgi:hypothetical protein